MDTVVNVDQAKAWNGWEGENWARNSDRYDAMNGGFNDALFQAADVGERDRVLDIGCGVGETTRLAARKAARGHVLGVDISEPMLVQARLRAHKDGLPNLTFERGDAQVHAFADGEFDVALSRGGVMFFADLVAAFANIARALRQGGRLAFLGPQAPRPDSDYARATAALTPWLRVPSPAASGMMSLIEPSRIEQVLDEAGFVDVTIDAVEAPMLLGEHAADAAGFILSLGPVRFNLDGVDQVEIDRVRKELCAGLEPYQTHAGVRIPGHVWVVSASRG
jgi:ubiquinone/menaquinone biosynthesis C-methylase UbiE